MLIIIYLSQFTPSVSAYYKIVCMEQMYMYHNYPFTQSTCPNELQYIYTVPISIYQLLQNRVPGNVYHRQCVIVDYFTTLSYIISHSLYSFFLTSNQFVDVHIHEFAYQYQGARFFVAASKKQKTPYDQHICVLLIV